MHTQTHNILCSGRTAWRNVRNEFVPHYERSLQRADHLFACARVVVCAVLRKWMDHMNGPTKADQCVPS